MRVDRRFLIVVGCSLIWAFLVAGLFYRVASRAGHPRAAQPERPVVVAARPLPLGDVIAADSVKIVQVPENLFPKGGFSRVEEVLERPVVSPIQPDEPVVEPRIAAKGSGLGLAPMIPPGMRAMSVRVNDVVGVAGFVLPGMRVDVLVTGHVPGGDDTTTTTVLQNILALSAGQTIQPDSKGQPISATVVTLLVTPAQAESLTLANSEGKIQLVLRNSTDQELSQTTGRQLRDLYGVERSRPALAAIVPARAPRSPDPVRARVEVAPSVQPKEPDEVVMIRGNQKVLERPASKVGN